MFWIIIGAIAIVFLLEMLKSELKNETKNEILNELEERKIVKR